MVAFVGHTSFLLWGSINLLCAVQFYYATTTRTIEFDDYTPDDLFSIFERLCQKGDYSLTDSAKQKVLSIFEKLYEQRNESFGNGRLVRTLFENTLELHSSRLAVNPLDSLDVIEAVDIADF